MLVIRNHKDSVRLHLLGYSITLLSGGVYLIRSEELASELLNRGFVEEYTGEKIPIGSEDLDQSGYKITITGASGSATSGWIPKYQSVVIV